MNETASLGETPAERQLFVRALASYSDACQLPSLTPECPFYELTDQGPLCAEQCRDLVAENAADLPRPDSFRLGIGLEAIRRPMPRRGPSEGDRAFDATERRLEDANKPVGHRRLSALVSGLQQALLVAADEASLDKCDEILSELKQRGVDTTQLVRRGLATTVRGAIFMLVLGVQGNEAHESNLAWRALLDELEPTPEGEPPDESGTIANRVFRPAFLEMMNRWIVSAPLKDLVSKKAPISAEIKRGTQPMDFEPPSDEMAWLVDRFTQTYLSEWKRASLMLEWRYQHALRPGCVSAASMRERLIDKADLAAAIADESCTEWENEGRRAALGSSLDVSQFASVALRALREERRDDAVGLYRGLLELRPNDAEVLNNLGFCLLPDSPREAIQYLTLAAESSEANHRATALTNIALAHRNLGEIDSAVGAISRALLVIESGMNAWMWPLDGGKVPSELLQLLTYAENLQESLLCQDS